MDFVGRQIAKDIAFTLPMSKIVSHNPLRINFRCHVCGDSATNAYKARGWFYERKGALRYGCFNCNYNVSIGTYLKEHNEEKFREYLLEKRKENGNSYEKPVEDTTKFTKVVPKIELKTIEKYALRLDTLPEGHPALLYMQRRLIPQEKLHLFWFTMHWRELSNAVVKDTYKFIEKEPRIVIPIFDSNGEISAMQGRALRSTEKLRYITIKSSEDANKVFGLERADGNRPVYYFEGPIDSVFINNAIAIVGGVMSLDEAPFKEKRVWVLDNEPRSKDTCKRILKLIEAGEKVVLWDKCRWSSKDINDFILKDGATVKEIEQYLSQNTVSGLAAKMRFGNWIKVKI